MAVQTKKLTIYSFLEDKVFKAWGEDYLDGKDVETMRYYTYCDALFFDQLKSVLTVNPGIGVGDAKYLVTRITSAMVREGLQFSIMDKNKKNLDDLQAFVKGVWTKNLMASKEADAEQYAARKGRGVFILNYSADSKRIIVRTVDPEFIWPVYNEYRELIGYKYIRQTSKEQNGKKIVWKEEYSKLSDKITKTTGEYVVTKDEKGVATYSVTGKELIEKLDIDFLPIIHFNNKPGDELEPESDLQPVIVILEKLCRNNFDTDETASLEASPPVIIEGTEPVHKKTKATAAQTPSEVNSNKKYAIGNGKVIFTGANGAKAYVLDVSKL